MPPDIRPDSTASPATFYVVGPTAVGKSDLAVTWAEEIGAEIVGCDAFQVYDGLPLLTAKPSEDLLARVRHHLVGEVPLEQAFDVGQYLALARARIAEIHAAGRHALVVGGTGMYLRALTHGLADIPPADTAIREELGKCPLDVLQSRLRELDPSACEFIDLQNPRRLIRALEVCLLTGRPFSSFRQEWNAPRPDLQGILLARSRDELYRRIDFRVEEMFRHGVVEEVETSLGRFGPTAVQTLGVSQIRDYLAGRLSRAECIEFIQQATRNYAKRQLTWFRKETWLSRFELAGSTEVVAQFATALKQA